MVNVYRRDVIAMNIRSYNENLMSVDNLILDG